MLTAIFAGLNLMTNVIKVFQKPKCEKPKTRPARALMRTLFSAIPFIAGVDKFFNFITQWHEYVSPIIVDATGVNPRKLMPAMGVGEMLVGVAVAVQPKIGTWMFASMLVGIAANLLTMPDEWHIMCLDLSIAVCSIAYLTLLD